MLGHRIHRVIAMLAVLFAGQAHAAPSAWESVIQAYELQDATSPPPSGQVVIAGSSSILLWSTMASDLAPLNVIGRGFGGSTAADLDYFLDRIVLKYSPRAVVIYEGDNDIGAGLTPAAIASTMGGILGRISARLPNARVYVISVKLSPYRIGQATQVRQLNQLYAALCASDARYNYIDIMNPLLGSDGLPIAAYFQSDNYHLSTSGYRVWTSAIRNVLVPQQQTPAPADATAPPVPGGLGATASGASRIDLRWDASSDGGVGLDGYRIWRNGQSLSVTTATTFADTGLLANTSYSYNVSAYDRVRPTANESIWSAPAFATTATQGAAPAVTLSATPATVVRGNGAQLSWSATDATSCTASGAWSGTRSAAGAQQTAALTATMVYTLSCVGPGGSGAASATVTVVPPPASVSLSAAPVAVASGGTAQLTWSSSDATACTASGGWNGSRSAGGSLQTGPLTAATTFTLTCSGAGGSGTATAVVAILPLPQVSLSATPPSVVRGGASALSWTSLNATGCIASGDWSGSLGASGSWQTPALSAPMRYVLTCTGPGGGTAAIAGIDVVYPPPVVSLTSSPTAIVSGGSSVLHWSASDADTCTASDGWSGPQTVSGTSQTAALTSSVTYRLTCTGPGGVAAASAVVDVMPLPVVTLIADRASIVSGSRAELSWTASNSVGCAAASGWSGARPVTGNEQTPALDTDTTFELTCSGPAGGSTTTSVTVRMAAAVVVTTTAASTDGGGSGGSGGSGGGGATRWIDLCLLSLLLLGGRRSNSSLATAC